MGAQENTRTSKPGKGSLDGLARRLGALEESLTIAAGEIGVSGVPKFKHLNPDAIYAEALRQTREAIEPLRQALQTLSLRLDEIAAREAQIQRELSAQHGNEEKISVLQGELVQLDARLDAALPALNRSDAALAAFNEKIERLSLRLDTIWERLDAERREQQSRKPLDAVELALSQRLGALELRLEKLANRIAAEQLATGNTSDVERQLAALRQEIAAQIEQRLDRQETTANASEAIAAEVSRQIAALTRENSPAADIPTPLLGDGPRGADPLVMNAAERAIVRLTRRLEKLEEWRRQQGGGKGKGGLMGRFFETED